MKIRKDDNVIVITGKDKGKTGKVVHAFPRENKVVVAGINIKKLHKRPTKSGQKGQIVDQAAPVHVSTVMLLDPKTNKRTRIGYGVKDGKKSRISKKSGATI
ncbi:MAG: 50S ribosomal protein L24 [Candidatus Zambryskibacteria bacterium RIFCSPHIGHO2_01_FULL_43_27]|uniref:Large ribosomal subunit protein uL24 n=1 Tax=Candidatus Zambryskibacteria bacterium RIFCSPLOWO2_01_FULL_43_17 TaxID=1802760 RepID=A0A1G2U423_9BACT|nr:MAG: 50S ribosomal protein L24 [Candidatus Zambryskibacteria bacterium RIFCSPHIGHO2_01_FULL_43_27]OHB00026.1 MAG: 50S ribosomal protein L24 [Candidatus Zambryskibacteria bacterium RIFCSPHIGHO2_12_FULL_43_12b]OHB04258.1 MAG: 50S ribosomal protein L24 [Candidatus Zambryskibacteria bacterium RIFCSPLOWO2_01_FULL_43_17]